ncbi:MAG TPA: hypothetical protein VD963_02245 [Phycisphaerales bacterium]|nr:hypothetical protein [Phycisphaerales bacterium]
MRRMLAGLVLACGAAGAGLGWGAHGHRTITYLALKGLPADAPEWMRSARTRELVAEQSNEPDRWRGLPSRYLKHENDPDHYIDVELLAQFGLTLQTVPPLRNEYLRAMAIAKHTHPESVEPYDAAKDPEAAKEWPGFLPHAIAEHYAKLRASLLIYRTVEALGEPDRAHQLELAQQNVIYHMGVLSHFVGDAAQPLHTTKHHHGWVGPNPEQYTTRGGIHSYIDSAIVDLHGLDEHNLAPLVDASRAVTAADPWPETLAYIERSFREVEPLYRLEKTGELDRDPGKQFISVRLADAASMLGALYRAAWESSAPTEQDLAAFVKYNNFRRAQPAEPGAASRNGALSRPTEPERLPGPVRPAR